MKGPKYVRMIRKEDWESSNLQVKGLGGYLNPSVQKDGLWNIGSFQWSQSRAQKCCQSQLDQTPPFQRWGN